MERCGLKDFDPFFISQDVILLEQRYNATSTSRCDNNAKAFPTNIGEPASAHHALRLEQITRAIKAAHFNALHDLTWFNSLPARQT
jgi:hypothetical protein